MALDPAIVGEARAILAHHARTFDLAGRLLPRQVRDRAAVVYAFCRIVDDAVDEAPSPEAARAQVRALSAELAGEIPRRPLVEAFVAVCEATGIPLEAAEELARGCESDLGEVIVADDGELLRYCYRVAGTVGLMMCGVLGVRELEAFPYALDLGIGMQLTNICRDVREDAERGRVYLPRTRLEAAGTSPEALVSGRLTPTDRAAVALVVRDLLDLAEHYYASGRAGMRYIPMIARPAIAAAGRVYRAIGLHLRRSACDAWAGRTVVPAWDKAHWLARAVVEAPAAGLTDGRRHDPSLHIHLRGLAGANPPEHAA